MAFEGLFIDLIKSQKIASDKDLNVYVELGKKFNLEEDSVFDGYFWPKFTAFIDEMQKSQKA